ncbi:hypothetical protein ACFKHW_09490 [Bradyrhizobium lupini]|uniref:hypothetical protein n=1 Tax=Rhizobium lupini TaxID=136996 RepID=UPI00366DAACF
MAEGYNPDRGPDGLSFSATLPFFPIGRFGGTYYWNPGSDTAPRWTVNRSLGAPGAGLEAVFLASGMTSRDTLGSGISGNVSTFIPSVSLNTTFPNGGGLLPPLAMPRVTSVGAGIGTLNMSPSLTTTLTPEQIAGWLQTFFAPRAMGPIDEVSATARTLTSRLGTIGPMSSPPVSNVSPRDRNLGDGMGDWRASTDLPALQDRAQPPAEQRPGGLLGMIQGYMRNNAY